MSVLIKGGRVVTASDDYVGDIFIEDGTISLIGASLDVTADKVIDASAAAGSTLNKSEVGRHDVADVAGDGGDRVDLDVRSVDHVFDAPTGRAIAHLAARPGERRNDNALGVGQ